MNLINIIFPFFDQLYIYQTLEYEPIPFLIWFYKHPFKRNLQRKHTLDLTSKVLLLSVTGLALMIILSLLISLFLGNLIFLPFIFIILSFKSPIFIVLASFLILPLEIYQKAKLRTKAKRKLKTLANLKVIGLVGSFAKTSTKDMLYTLLWKKFNVVKTPKSFNTEVSIAQTILDYLKSTTEIFLVEMDAYHQGEINNLAKLVKPNFGIITGIAPQHLERFGSMEKLIKTQFEIQDNLPSNGKLFLNSQEIETKNYITNQNSQIVWYGLDNQDDFYATDIKTSINGTTFTLNHKEKQIKINLPLFGTHHVMNFLAAASIGYNLGLSLEEISQRADKILPTPHRLEIKKQGDLTIIDNSYNTNPNVSKTALKLLSDYPGKQKIIITPGLVELGKISFEENQKFGMEISKIADKVIIIGNNARRAILSGLKQGNFPKDNIYEAKTLIEGLNILNKTAIPETVVLLENDLPDQYF